MNNKTNCKKRCRYIAQSLLLALVGLIGGAFPVFAAGEAGQIVAQLQIFINIIALIIGVWGAVQLILSFVNDTPQSRASAVTFLGAGIGLLAVGQVLVGLLGSL